MARLSRLVVAGLLALAGASAHAFYGTIPTPPGFAPMPAAAPVARFGVEKMASQAWVNNVLRTTIPANVGGQAVKLPVAYKLAPNASRFASAALFAHPGLRAAIGIASLLAAAKVMWDESKQQWVQVNKNIEETDGYQYRGTSALPWSDTREAACSAMLSLWTAPVGGSISAAWNGTYCVRVITEKNGQVYKTDYPITGQKIPCPAGWETTPAGCRLESGTTRPLTTPEEFEPAIMKPKPWPNVPADWPMPSTVPNEVPPGTPLPVEQPIINPTPGDNPKPQPYFVPTGNPVPNPNYDPNAAPSPENQPWFQPGVRIVPSPTPDQPWRVDVQPVNRPTNSPTSKSTDELNNPNPATDPATDPVTDPAKDDKAKDEDKQDLCEKHPDILACQNLDTPSPDELAKEDISISISPVAGWGSSSAACPAPRPVMVAGKSVEISWQPVCDFASGLRPLVIALAWLSAASIVIVVARRN